jgi:3(or 17)beta-hydroxysteroid dehydrogenase
MAEGRIAGKTAIVTGGASGIGAAIATTLSAEGARVAISDLNEEAGADLAVTLRDAVFIRHDVTLESEWKSCLASVEDCFGGLDIIVNNAGVMPATKTIEDTSYDEWKRVMSVNLDGVFLGVKHGIGAMKDRGGAIVNVSSIMGLVGQSIVGAYSASKGGVRLFTKSAAIECANLGYPIRINSVHPGYIDGGMFAVMADEFGADSLRERFAAKTPMKRLGTPEEIAKGVLFLVSDDASFSTGSELVLDGGYTAR